MSIHDLLGKINGSPGGLERGGKWPMLLISLSLLLGITALGASTYLISKFQAPLPIQIQCSDEVINSLQATSTPIKVEKPVKKVPKASKVKVTSTKKQTKATTTKKK